MIRKKDNFVKLLKNNISVYQKKYIYQEPELFEGWKTSNHYLTDENILKGILNLKILGIFFSNFPNSFCIDIDDHKNLGEGYLLQIYQKVLQRINFFPSFICKTPHGFHAYYFLEYHIHINILIKELKILLEGLPVEIKPTHNTAARIPRIDSFLDVLTLKPIQVDFQDVFLHSVKYHPAELFAEKTEAAYIRQALKDRKISVLSVRETKTLAKAENEFIQKGNSNNCLCDLIPLYRASGLNVREAALRYTALLDESYEGELRNFARLESRIKSFYRKTPDNKFNTVPKQKQLDLFFENMLNNIESTVTGIEKKGSLVKKRRTVRKAVEMIESWKNYIDSVKSNRTEREFWNYLYPFFKKNTKEGYYPIPQSFFKKLHTRYNEFLQPHLIKIGYLEKSPYGYSNLPDKTNCYHWKINSANFV